MFDDGASTPNYYLANSFCNPSIKQCRQQIPNPNRRLKKGSTLTEHNLKRSLTAQAVIAQSKGTNGQNVANSKGRSSRSQQYADENCPRTSEPKPTGVPLEIQCQFSLPDMRSRRPFCKRLPISDTQHISLWERAIQQADNY